MASRTYTPFKVKRGIEKTLLMGETTLSTSDTFTIGELKATANPLYVSVFKKSDGSTATITYAAGTNVVTITAVGTNIDCFFMAYGYKVN